MTRFAIAATVILLFPLIVWSQQQNSSPAVSSIAFAGILPGSASDNIGDAPEERTVSPSSMLTASNTVPAPSPVFRVMETQTMLPSAELQPVDASAQTAVAGLQMFAGARIRDVIQLNWVSTTGSGILGFEVERRSQLHTDWERVAYLRSDPQLYGSQEYTFLDHLRGDGVSYYRLRQVRTDGQTVSSPVVSVTPDDVPATSGVWQHALHPFQNYGTVSFGLNRPAEVKLTLHDRFGNTIAVILDHRRMDEGHHIIPFGARELQPGLYFLRMHSDAGSRTMVFMRS